MLTWLFLAVVIDLFSRQVVGWSLRGDMTSNIVIDALRMAWFRRHPDKHAGALLHSDRGPGATPRMKPSRGCPGTTKPGCMQRWLMSARCNSKANGFPGKPTHELGYGIRNPGARSLAQQTGLAEHDADEVVAIFWMQSCNHAIICCIASTCICKCA